MFYASLFVLVLKTAFLKCQRKNTHTRAWKIYFTYLDSVDCDAYAFPHVQWNPIDVIAYINVGHLVFTLGHVSFLHMHFLLLDPAFVLTIQITSEPLPMTLFVSYWYLGEKFLHINVYETNRLSFAYMNRAYSFGILNKIVYTTVLLCIRNTYI